MSKLAATLCVVACLSGAITSAAAAVANAEVVRTSSAASPERDAKASDYLIGVGDTLVVWVWKNPDLSTDMPVRPDGRISTPLVQDIQAQGRTPTDVAADLRRKLSAYVQEPVVTVLVKAFAPAANVAAIHVIGAAASPKTVSYRAGITALDVLIEAGGLNTFANGDGAKLIRSENGAYHVYPLRLNRLIKAGDLAANVDLKPGDTIRIPERWF